AAQQDGRAHPGQHCEARPRRAVSDRQDPVTAGQRRQAQRVERRPAGEVGEGDERRDCGQAEPDVHGPIRPHAAGPVVTRNDDPAPPVRWTRARGPARQAVLMNSHITAVIIGCEIAFWVIVAAGLALRYPARRPRAATLVLLTVPLVDLVLLAAVALDLR